MLFTTLPFAILVATTFVAFYATGSATWQTAVLIIASMIFYGYGQPGLLILLVASALINGGCAAALARRKSAIERRVIAVGGVIVNVAVLVFFKYAGLVAGSLAAVGMGTPSVAEWLATIPLPIGISFYTFQGISLVVDTWRGDDTLAEDRSRPRLAACQSQLVRGMLFVLFFPQLVAGPIVKAHDFYPQIQPKRFGDIPWAFVVRSLITGYFLKMVIADNLHEHLIWMQRPYFFSQAPVILAMLLVAYSAQIFADFAGYSAIAIGLAALFGYRLRPNFDFPYIADSFGNFWRRWHISLSSWLREYLYIPLGGNRHGETRTLVNLFLVMVLGGLWHGAAWKYATWGVCHGLLLAAERPFRNTWPLTSRHPLCVVVRSLVVLWAVSLAWLLFSLPALTDAGSYLVAMVTNSGNGIAWWLGLTLAIYVTPVAVYHLLFGIPAVRQRVPQAALPMLYGIMLALTVFNRGNSQPFIYFQF